MSSYERNGLIRSSRRSFKQLKDFEKTHPWAEIEAYRQNSVSVRIRVIDLEFNGQSRAQREEQLWKVLERLPEEVAAEISMLLLLTPEESKKSFAGFEFDSPVPSNLWCCRRFGNGERGNVTLGLKPSPPT